MHTVPSTMPRRWYRGLVNNATNAAHVSMVPTTTKPATVDSSADPTANTVVLPCEMNSLKLFGFGTNGDGDTFDIQVVTWQQFADSTNPDLSGDPDTALWMPSQVLEATFTLSSTVVGVASSVMINTEYGADKVAVETTISFTEYKAASNDQNVGTGFVLLDNLAAELVQISFKIVTATACNVGYCFL